MAEKTEQATPKKLSDARKKGQVAKSQDVPSAITFIVSIAVTLALFEWVLAQLGVYITSCFKVAAAHESYKLITGKLTEGYFTLLTVSLPILGAVTFAGVLTNFILIGPLLTFDVFKPDINRFNPVENIKQKFKLKTWIELLKSVVKISIAGYLLYTIILAQIPAIIQTVALPLLVTLGVVKQFFTQMVIKVGIFFIIIAFADLIYQKKVFAGEMKMEKHEVKQEYKNSEGDPEIKGKRKQIAKEIAYSEGGTSNVRKAKAIVTNPTHIAVALAYAPEEGIIAPFILTMGKGYMAEQIIKEAVKHDIPIMQNIYLARKLFSEGQIDQFVPEETYEAIAEVLKWVASLRPPQS